MAAKFIFTNVLGSFVFDGAFRIIDSDISEKDLQKRHPHAVKPSSEKEISAILGMFRQRAKDFYSPNLALAIKSVRESVNSEVLAIQAIALIEDLNVVTSMLAKRLREWYEYYNPEFSKALDDHEKFAKLIQKKDKAALLAEIGVAESESMGSGLEKKDIEPIIYFAEELTLLFEHRNLQKKYLDSIITEICPNTSIIAGTLITAKLLEQAGSLKRLSSMPASTVQLLGAEKALFRHLKDKRARSPKYGHIFNHPLMAKIKKENRGKAARAIADKISIALKVDYFKGDPIGEELKRELEKKVSKW